MVLRFFTLAAVLFFASCSDVERSNPDDPGSDKYRGEQVVSSTSVEVSSSSAAAVSSSSKSVSSSSIILSSSSRPSSSSSSSLANTIWCLYSGGCVAIASEACSAIDGQAVQSCPTASSSSESQDVGQIEENVFTDPRDGKKYKCEVASNGKIWMSENLNYSRSNTLGYCYGVNVNGTNPHRDSTTCDNGYGRIYEYATAIDGNPPQGLCPNGWHIPSVTEWNPIVKINNTYIMEKMSSDFYIYPGNYNLNTEYPPIGWKERNESGFYWTSSGNKYFTGFFEGKTCKSSTSVSASICPVEAQSTASERDYFSVRCIKD